MFRKAETLILRFVPPVTTVAILVSTLAVFFWVPNDKMLGVSQRIFYYHVPSASTCFAAFILAGVLSAIFLKTRNDEWDHAAHASVGVGMIYASVVLATGSIWARTAWGTWWTWDARLTTFLILWLVYAVYLLLRIFSQGNDMAPRYAAVLAIAGALNIPLVMMATRLWRTIHPKVINNPKGGIDDPSMIATLILSMVALFSLFLWLLALRMKMLRLHERTEILLADHYQSSQIYPGGAAR